MKCKVKKLFKNVDGSMKLPGESIEIDEARAERLLKYGFISGLAETAKKEPPERAVKESPQNKKKAPAPVHKKKAPIQEKSWD